MTTKFIWQPLAIAVLISGFPILKSVSANPPIQIAQSIWKPLSSSEGNFSVLMPGTPREVKQSINTKAGAIQLHLYMIERKQEEVNYIVGYTDYPESYIQSLNRNQLVEKALDEGRNSALRQTKGKLLNEKRISLGNYPGREISYEDRAGKITKHRLFLVNKRLYQLMAKTTKTREKYLTKSILGFFDSFQLLSR